MTATPQTIILSTVSQNEKEYPLESASFPITPGMICEINADGNVIPHDAVAIPQPFIVAVEMPIRPTSANASSGIEDPYNVADEQVPVHYAQSGDRLYMMLEAGANVAKNDKLESCGNGHLQAATSYAIVRALEAVDNSAGYDGTRIRVEVL